MSMPGNYGYSHRGRLLKAGDVTDTWMVEIPDVAPGRAWGPIPSVTPGLQVGDRVLLTQVGTTRGDIVIVGRIPGAQPDYTEIPGLAAALAAKANESDLAALTTRVGTDETNIAANSSAITTNSGAITTNSGAITTLQGRLTADEATITSQGTRLTTAEGTIVTHETRLTADDATLLLLTGNLRTAFGNDVEINTDAFSTCPRALASASRVLTNGQATYAKLRTQLAVTVRGIKFCLSTAGVGGALKVAAWSGSSSASLTYQGTLTASLSLNRQDWILTTPIVLAAHDYLVVGFLGTANTTVPALSASPVVNTTLLNQDATVLTALITTSTTLTTLGTSALNMATATGYTSLGQIPWVAAAL